MIEVILGGPNPSSIFLFKEQGCYIAKIENNTSSNVKETEIIELSTEDFSVVIVWYSASYLEPDTLVFFPDLGWYTTTKKQVVVPENVIFEAEFCRAVG